MALFLVLLFPGVVLGLQHVKDPCSVDHTADLYKPMEQVIRENPGVDMYCYFEAAGRKYAMMPGHDPGLRIWVNRRGKNTPNYAEIARSGAEAMKHDPATCGDGWKGDGSGPLVTFKYEGGELQTHLDCGYYSYDDLYFYTLGWLKNQGIDGSLLSNATAWEEQAAKECEKIKNQIHPTIEETSLGYNADQNAVIGGKAGCAVQHDCPPVTIREFKLHIYTKCLMGGAAQEMAYGYGRACLLKDKNMVGHGIECEDK